MPSKIILTSFFVSGGVLYRHFSIHRSLHTSHPGTHIDRRWGWNSVLFKTGFLKTR